MSLVLGREDHGNLRMFTFEPIRIERPVGIDLGVDRPRDGDGASRPEATLRRTEFSGQADPDTHRDLCQMPVQCHRQAGATRQIPLQVLEESKHLAQPLQLLIGRRHRVQARHDTEYKHGINCRWNDS